MTLLYVRQLNDGVQSGGEVAVVPHYDGQTALELLALKETSHLLRGWTVGVKTLTSLQVWKSYDHPKQPSRVDRYFEVRG